MGTSAQGGQRTRGRGRARAAAGALAIVAIGALHLPTTPAGAAPVPVSLVPVAGWSTNGPVYATAIIGDTVYAGGSFSQVRSQGGGQTVARTNLAAFDGVTGAIRTGFTADTNGVVRALLSDGTRLYVGGSFTTVRGVARQRLAALDPASGVVNTGFVANASSHVYALARQGTRLYVGGAFGTINNATRNRLAAVTTATGAVDPVFLPNPNNSVRGLAASPDGAVVYAGGQFTAIGGAARNFLGAVSASTGANTGRTFTNAPDQQVLTLDIAPAGNRLFVGSSANRAASYDTATGARQWFQQADGDLQAIRYHAGNVYFGFHESFGGDTTVRLLAADAATGVIEPWRPTINSFYGVWAIAASDGALAVGGEFTRFSGVNTQGIAVLGTAVADNTDPTPPNALGVTGTTGTSVTLGWTAGTDNVAVGGYRVSRNGIELAFVTGTSYADTGLTGGTEYDYAVETVDTSGNRSAAATVSATTDVALVSARSVWRYSDTGADLGTPWRAVAYPDASWSAGPGQLGYGDGDEATIVSFGPDTNNKYPTTYFRRHLTVADPTAVASLTLQLLRDDGAVAYLNGTEVARSNLPTGTIAAATPRATASIGGADENTYLSFAVNPALLVPGDNVLAIEVHQVSANSSDLSFDAALSATLGAPTPDQTPPSAPTGVSATTIASGQVVLVWNPSTDNLGVTGYDIRRGGVLIGTSGTTTYTDATVTPSTSYTYTVAARDAAGNASPPSAGLPVTTPAPSATVTVIPAGSVWHFTEDGIDRGTAWRTVAYNDSTWPTGAGQLGYGDGDETTVMFNGGTQTADRFVSHYLRRGFAVTGAASVSSATLSVLRDDGVVVYVNGVEAFRDNMPTGTVTNNTYATTGLSGADESTYVDFAIPPSLLVEGANVIAVSLHNNSRSGSGDISFDARLTFG